MNGALDLRTRLQAHLRPGSPYFQAASAALEQVGGARTLAPRDVDAWLQRLWPDNARHGGTVDPLAAQRALEAFADRRPPPVPAKLDGATVRLGSPAARLMRTDDGVRWTDRVDTSSVAAQVAAFTAELDAFFRLDLSKPEGYRAFGQWCGWTVPEKDYARGSSYEDATVRYWLGSTLRQRHKLPEAFRDKLEAVFDASLESRSAVLDMFRSVAAQAVGKAAERMAIFDAFLVGAGQTVERIETGRLDKGAVRAELEEKLGLPPGKLEENEIFREVLEQFSFRELRRARSGDRAPSPEELAAQVKDRSLYVQEFIRQYVVNA